MLYNELIFLDDNKVPQIVPMKLRAYMGQKGLNWVYSRLIEEEVKAMLLSNRSSPVLLKPRQLVCESIWRVRGAPIRVHVVIDKEKGQVIFDTLRFFIRSSVKAVPGSSLWLILVDNIYKIGEYLDKFLMFFKVRVEPKVGAVRTEAGNGSYTFELDNITLEVGGLAAVLYKPLEGPYVLLVGKLEQPWLNKEFRGNELSSIIGVKGCGLFEKQSPPSIKSSHPNPIGIPEPEIEPKMIRIRYPLHMQPEGTSWPGWLKISGSFAMNKTQGDGYIHLDTMLVAAWDSDYGMFLKGWAPIETGKAFKC